MVIDVGSDLLSIRSRGSWPMIVRVGSQACTVCSKCVAVQVAKRLTDCVNVQMTIQEAMNGIASQDNEHK